MDLPWSWSIIFLQLRQSRHLVCKCHLTRLRWCKVHAFTTPQPRAPSSWGLGIGTWKLPEKGTPCYNGNTVESQHSNQETYTNNSIRKTSFWWRLLNVRKAYHWTIEPSVWFLVSISIRIYQYDIIYTYYMFSPNWIRVHAHTHWC